MAGKIVHFELPSPPTPTARAAFWSGLFGWEIGEQRDGGLRLPDVPDRRRPGRRDLSRREKPVGAPIVYFDTDDIDASVAKVRELGGAADEKQPVPTHGWFAACKDTEGNSFSLWQGDPNAA